MGEALKMEAVIGEGGKLDCPAVDLPQGTKVQLVLTPILEKGDKIPMMDFFGTGKGLFETPEDAVAYLRKERDLADEGMP